MRCDDVQRALSAALDEPAGEELSVELSDHVGDCAACAAFDARIRTVRRALRVEPLDGVPDIAGAVMDRLEQVDGGTAGVRRPSRWLAVAAAFVAGAMAGSLLIVATDGDGTVAAAEIAGKVIAAQRDVTRLDATLDVVERGWHPAVPDRRYSGRLVYEAPERLWLSLEDETAYPSAEWTPNHVTLVVDGQTRWTSGVRDCPVSAQPQCTPGEPRLHAVHGREPFEAAWPLPLELVTPVGGFLPSSDAAFLERGRVARRSAIGVTTTAAAVADLLDAVRPAGNMRTFHPADTAELWLDEEAMVPLRLRILAGTGADRERWAAALGYDDRAGEAILDLRVATLRLDGASPVRAPGAPAGAVIDTAGFAPTGWPSAHALEPAHVPRGFTRHVAGRVSTPGGPDVGVLTWTDGRAWLKVRSTRSWPGGRLFGDVGGVVRRVDIEGGSTVYVSEDGRAVAVHGDGVDAVVTGSVPTDSLVAVARSLPVSGEPVPGSWGGAGAGGLDDARRALPGLLAPARRAGFAPPAVAVHGERVLLSYAGPGTRGFVAAQTPGDRLSPPLDPRATAVAVRGVTGRWNPERGELEWVESGLVVSLTSRTLSLAELLAIAGDMEEG